MKIVTGYKNLYVVSFSIYSVSTAVVLLSIRSGKMKRSGVAGLMSNAKKLKNNGRGGPALP